MKKIITAALCFALTASVILSLAACGGSETKANTEIEKSRKSSQSAVTKKEETTEEQMSMVNPLVEYDSLEEAKKASGLNITFPDKITPEKYVVIDKSIIEVDYDGGYIRKAKMGGDISGDYNVYNYSTVLSSGEKAITYKGDSQNEIKLAIWAEGENSFCLYSETPLTPGKMISYINAIS